MVVRFQLVNVKDKTTFPLKNVCFSFKTLIFFLFFQDDMMSSTSEPTSDSDYPPTVAQA